MPRDDYEDRQAERRERLEARAEKQEAEAARRNKTATDYFHQMNGQPILVGHHSEKRHRSQIAKAEGNYRKAHELEDKAKANRSAAASVGTNGRGGEAISSDDPEAVIKLREKIAELEARRDAMKAANKKAKAAWVQGGKEGTWEKPYPSYSLTNLGANLRRYKARLVQAEHEAAHADDEPTVTMQGDGWTVEERPDLNRIHIDCGGVRLGSDLFRAIRACGFRWSRTEEVFSRHLNDSGRFNALRAVQLADFCRFFGDHEHANVQAYPRPYEAPKEPEKEIHPNALLPGGIEFVDFCRQVLETGPEIFRTHTGGRVDGFTASAIVQVYDAIPPEVQEKFVKLPPQIMARNAFRAINEASKK